jgi:hypothetical protein
MTTTKEDWASLVDEGIKDAVKAEIGQLFSVGVANSAEEAISVVADRLMRGLELTKLLEEELMRRIDAKVASN